MRTINSTFYKKGFKILYRKDSFKKDMGKEEKENNEIGLYQEFYQRRQL